MGWMVHERDVQLRTNPNVKALDTYRHIVPGPLNDHVASVIARFEIEISFGEGRKVVCGLCRYTSGGFFEELR